MRSVAVLAVDDVVPFDMAVPLEIFGRAQREDGTSCYEVQVCGEKSDVSSRFFGISSVGNLEFLEEEADIVVVPGSLSYRAAPSDRMKDALHRAHERGARVASICLGAFTLAAVGLLDGQRATTHWMAAAELAADYPDIDVDPAVLFVDNESVLTSAGAAAGLDLCLHMVRRDYGSAVAADTARLSVMPLTRDGGQAQFIAESPRSEADYKSINPTLEWAESMLSGKITVSDLAARAGVSNRTLIRRFSEQVRMSPNEWLQMARVRKSQELLETTNLTIDCIADQVGFTSVAALRIAFRKTVGLAPHAYRKAFV
ncbi:helix-turn-helix domain-containing protein [Nocardia sp. NBC_01503]|uniref:GlxA family transcriptional regulator n=1 Tax=Nocardia sp. NBC_01503 TaxID=2975997 RepID=UPI002E7BCAD2|nr:helix-turn-helix domain-containing protein [Nocardia sp. NBC_01503]WTL32783.1 helix-turn-helix domain-containing protein [Nocardia sp. NBC_01503]